MELIPNKKGDGQWELEIRIDVIRIQNPREREERGSIIIKSSLRKDMCQIINLST